jgi:hypothetical protein
MIDQTLIAEAKAARDEMLREIECARKWSANLATAADLFLDWRRGTENRIANWEKQSALLNSIIDGLLAATGELPHNQHGDNETSA